MGFRPILRGLVPRRQPTARIGHNHDKILFLSYGLKFMFLCGTFESFGYFRRTGQILYMFFFGYLAWKCSAEIWDSVLHRQSSFDFRTCGSILVIASSVQIKSWICFHLVFRIVGDLRLLGWCWTEGDNEIDVAGAFPFISFLFERKQHNLISEVQAP